MVPQTGPYMDHDVRTLLGVSLALVLLMGTVVLAGIGVEGLLGVDVLGLQVPPSGTDDAHQDDSTGGTAGFTISTQWVMRNSTRDQLQHDWRARQNGTGAPETYCLRTRSLVGDRTEIYAPKDQAFEERSTDGATDDVCDGTHPVVLRPSQESCSPVGRDYWMLGHIGIDAAIVQCQPDTFILYTDDDFEGAYVPRPGRNVTVDESGNVSAGRIPVTLG